MTTIQSAKPGAFISLTKAAGLPPATESVAVDEVQLSWFDRHLKGSPAGPEAPVRLYRMGMGTWESLPAWPEVTEEVLWLASGGAAMSRRGDGVLTRGAAYGPPDHLVSDPHTPVLSQGGNSCCIGGLAPMGQTDQAKTEMRNDVLVYTSAPLAEPLGILGTPVLELFVSSSSPSDDWVARLTDVDDQGRSVNVSQGIQRVWNQGSEQVRALRLELRPTSWMFASGHRIRLQITGADYPAHDVNAHTDRPTGTVGEAGMRVSMPAVLHQGRWPSRLVLPHG
ncbi:MAG: CocE/NonD family hydrolase [Propionibacteriaceae bacterium]